MPVIAPPPQPVVIQAPAVTSQASPAQPATPAGQPAPQAMVNALYSAFGDNHSRAVHARGIMAVGTFEPDAAAATLTTASLFAQGAMPVRVRFSNFTGIPDIPDNIGDANPRGLALKFSLADGTTSDVVTHSFNGFPTASSAEFRDLLLSIGASGAGAAKPTALDAFLEAHPIARTFLTTQKPLAESYGTLAYFGVNAFEFTAADGRRSFVRYRFVPRDGEVFLPVDARASAGANYLQEELPVRLGRGPIVYDWYAQVAEAGDLIDDPSIAWPETRRLVRLGAVRIEWLAPATEAADKATMFNPLNVPQGIAPADPMLTVREGAYPLSLHHRQ